MRITIENNVNSSDIFENMLKCHQNNN